MRKFTLCIALVAMLTYSCHKTDADSGMESSALSKSTKSADVRKNSGRVYVNNVEELYAAVYDPRNEGSTIVLAAGTYVLSPNYPKAGRIELG